MRLKSRLRKLLVRLFYLLILLCCAGILGKYLSLTKHDSICSLLSLFITDKVVLLAIGAFLLIEVICFFLPYIRNSHPHFESHGMYPLLHDAPTDQDRMGRKEYAEALVNKIVDTFVSEHGQGDAARRPTFR